MAIITSDDVEQQSSTSSIEPVEHQEASIFNKVDFEILEENCLKDKLLIGEKCFSKTGFQLKF